MTVGASRLLERFESGALTRPCESPPTLVDLSRAIALLSGAGASDLADPDERANPLADAVGGADHLILVLVDGMGLPALEALPRDSFLRTRVKSEMRAVFPSTTAAALVSLSTGEWPSRHGLPTWWVYLPRRGITATALPFAERFGRLSLSTFGVEPSEVFPTPSILPRFRRRCLTLVPAGISGSVYTRHASGGTPVEGYPDVDGALRRVRERVTSARERTFTYLYLPEYDGLCHERGSRDAKTLTALAGMDSGLGRLREALPPSARLIVTADHGIVDVPEEERVIVRQDDPMMAHLVCPPSGEPRVPVFHCREGHLPDLRAELEERLAGRFAVLEPGEVEEMQLLGPGGVSALTRERLGDLVAVSTGRAALMYRPHGTDSPPHVGHHAGLLPEETRVPLVIA